MATTYTWTITSINGMDPDNDNDLDIIKSASWNLTGNNGISISTINGMTPLNITLVEGELPGIHWNVLTEAEVITAVQEALGINAVNSYYAGIDNNLVILESPQPVARTLPWA